MALLTPSEIKTRRIAVPTWRKVGRRIRRTFEFKDFPAAIRFVNAIARRAENASHHPDIDIRWNKVTLTLSTHDEGGLTAKDFDLAAQCDRAYARAQP